MEQMAALGGMILVVFAVMMVLGLLVGGLILKFSVRLLQGFSPSYGKSILVVFLSGVVCFIINIALTMVMGVGAGMGDPTAMGNEAAMAGAMMSISSRPKSPPSPACGFTPARAMRGARPSTRESRSA